MPTANPFAPARWDMTLIRICRNDSRDWFRGVEVAQLAWLDGSLA